jgi:hypothetical protein
VALTADAPAQTVFVSASVDETAVELAMRHVETVRTSFAPLTARRLRRSRQQRTADSHLLSDLTVITGCSRGPSGDVRR